MILASQLRSGMAIRFEKQIYRVINADYHPGQGKMGGVTHARLKNLATQTQWEHSFRSDLKLEELSVERRPYEFVYRDGDDCYFMDPESFEQLAVPAATLGDHAVFLSPQMKLTLEFIDDQVVGGLFPDHMEVVIADTAPPSHGSDNVWKPARLDNGVEVMVPPFVKSGDAIRLDLATRKYVDRARDTRK